MGRFDKLPGIDGENTTRRNVLVGSGYALGGLVVLGSTSSGDEDSSGEDDVNAGASGGDTSDDGSSNEDSGGGDESTETDRETETDQETETEESTEEPNTTHEMGESFEVGSGGQSIRYTVVDALTADALGNDALSEEADGRFVVVILRMENIGEESLDITARNLKLVDSQNREFEADTEASMYVESDPRIDVEAITFDQLQPGLEVERAVIFDVAPGESYAFKADPQGVFSTADSHFVPLGEVTEG